MRWTFRVLVRGGLGGREGGAVGGREGGREGGGYDLM